jgi:3-oxoacyl-[acyl-carrier protein] reductase
VDNNVFISGGSRGIGAELVIQFAKKGYGVAFSYNSSAREADQMLTALTKTGCTDFTAVKCDVSVKSDVENAIKAAKHALGSIDILINNAGVSSYGLFSDVTENEFDRVFNVNVKGVFNCCQCVIPDMVRNKSGKIINISSMWGEVGASCEAVYSASKAAVIGLTKSLAKELAPSGINVNCISPGIIATDMLSSFSTQELECLKNDTPLGRIGVPSDVAKAALFLASGDSDFITGQVISVNGGFVI